MINPTFLLETLRVNELSESSTKEEIEDFLRSLKWLDQEVVEAINILKKRGWFVVENPFNQITKSQGSFLFKIREYSKFLITKLLKLRINIDKPQKKPPSFNVMKAQVVSIEHLTPKQSSTKKPILKFLIRRLLRNTLLITIVLGLVVIAYHYRLTLLSLYWINFSH